jgi:hypothetical protein
MQRGLSFVMALVALTGVVACSRTAASPSEAAAAAPPAVESEPSLQTLKLTYDTPTVGPRFVPPLPVSPQERVSSSPGKP